jgi:Uma2 family endonuclease
MAGFRHGVILMRLLAFLDSYVTGRGLGQVLPDGVNYVLKGTPQAIEVMRIPDASFVREARVDRQLETFAYFAPDLAVEVISPSETWADVQAKVSDYLRYGTAQVWVFDPQTRETWVYEAGGQFHVYQADETLRAEALFGADFALPLAPLYA